MKILVLACVLLCVSLVKSQKCLDSNTHKPEPTPELNLFGQCKLWNKLSCCTNQTAENLHLTDTPWNGFNYNHCFRISSKCRKRLIQELCLYECDPYLDNWIVQDFSKKMRKERYFKIPLCKKDCDNWFNDCKDDFTCRDNWNKGFKWINGTNYCRAQDKCVTIKDKFKTAENFCNKIWDDSFEVNNTDKCFTFEFDSSVENPNKKVAEYYKNLNN